MSQSTPLIDVEGALTRLGGSRAILKKILSSFLQTEELSQLEAAIQGNDAETAARIAHTIKGVAGNLSLTALYEASIALEGNIKQNGLVGLDTSAFATLWHETKSVVAKTIDAL